MSKHKIQWHPFLGRLLRHRVERYYELTTNVAVGDLPRQADIVVLRRTTAAAPPFRGLWRYLTTWNVLEYKGATVTPRREHVPFLVEVGLGIARRLNAQRRRERLRSTPPEEISFWYLANRLGPTFLRAAANRLGRLDPLDRGIWKSTVLGHPCLFVSTVDLPVDEDSLPLHVLGVESLEQQVAVGQFVIEEAGRLEVYGSLFAALHPAAWEEVKTMARSRRGGLQFDFRPIVEEMGLDKIIEQIGAKQVIEEIGAKQVIEQLGTKQVIEELGTKQFIEQVGIDDLLANLTPAQRRELLRRLTAESERKKS